MSYNKTNWQNLPSTDTPIIANSLNNMENGIADANGALAVVNYSNSDTYEVGDYVIYDNKLYKCNIAISTAEDFNSSKWTQIKIAEEMNNNGVSVSSTEPTGNNKNKVWIKKSKNSFNAYEYSYTLRNTNETYQINNTNSISVTSSNTTWARVSFIISNLKPNTSYTISSIITNTSSRNAAIIVSVGSTEKQNTSAATNIKLKVTFTTDSTGTATVALFANWSSSSLSGTIIYNNLQLEEGITDTQFEDYVKPAIYTKNDNNVYEEFIMPENKVYSTGEVRIGTWIDGKPLYRKVIKTTTPTVSSNGTSAWQQITFPNVSFAMLTNCQMYYVGTYGPVITPITKTILSAGLNQYISANVTINQSNNNGVLQIESSSTALNNRTIYAIIEYTKVTD